MRRPLLVDSVGRERLEWAGPAPLPLPWALLPSVSVLYPVAFDRELTGWEDLDIRQAEFVAVAADVVGVVMASVTAPEILAVR